MSTAELYIQLEQLSDERKQSVSDFIAFLLKLEAEKNIGKEKPKPVFGSGKGMFIMSPDFDEPIEDFKEYM